MNRIRKNCLLIQMSILLCMVFFSGCGKIAQTDGNPEENQIYYRIQDTTIPNPDEALGDAIKENGWVRNLEFTLKGKTIYRLARVFNETDGMPEAHRDFVQILETPYEEWMTYEVSSQYWDEEYEWTAYSISDMQVSGEGQVYFWLHSNLDNKEYLGSWEAGAPGKLLCTIPLSINEKSWDVPSLEESYLYQGNALSVMDQNLQIKKDYILPGDVYGVIKNPVDKKIYWYGINDDGFGIWRIEDGVAILQNFEEINTVDSKVVHAAFSLEGILYLTDMKSMWKLEDSKEPVKLFDYLQQDCFMEDLQKMSVLAEDDMLLLAKYEKEYHLLSVKEGERPAEKQEITLAVFFAPGISSLQKSIMQFNRENEKYHVKLLNMENEKAWLEYLNKIQMEVSAGRGPDLLLDNVIDARACAENGYIQSMEGMLEEDGDYWQIPLEGGKIHGIQYGIPYECEIILAAYSEELTGGKTTWTVSEMMEAVRASQAEMLCYDYTGTDIVYNFGLLDNDNKDYIDWEKGESHLTEAPFLELLSFAKEYADRGQYKQEEVGEMMQQGKIAAHSNMYVFDLSEISFLEACFQGKSASIGFPCVKGNGIYVRSVNLYWNSSSDKREGIKEFITYLLSEEVQKRYVEFIGTKFAVRLSAIEYSIERMCVEKEYPIIGYGYHEYNGIQYYMDYFTEIEAEKFRFLLEHAKPNNWNVSAISEIIYEELTPYFEGDRTAKEAAKILDNRVQLYLDER